MKNKNSFTLAIVSLSLLLFTLFFSCQKRVDSDEQWRIANEKAFSEFADSADYVKKMVEGSDAFVYMKTLKKGEGKDFPIETSRVLMHYQANLLAGEKNMIDGNYDSEAPMRFALSRGKSSDLITGMRIGLQNMVQGEEAVIIIPWYLAYGGSKVGAIPAYTSFRYQVRLDSIIPEDAL